MYQELGSLNWKQSGDLDPSTLVVAMDQPHIRSGRGNAIDGAPRGDRRRRKTDERAIEHHGCAAGASMSAPGPGKRVLKIRADRWARARASQTAPPTSARTQTQRLFGLHVRNKTCGVYVQKRRETPFNLS